METVAAALTVLFEDPFWIGLVERVQDGCYDVCKITFGAEPKDNEVFEFLLDNYFRLSFSPSVSAKKAPEAKRINPKRMQREVTRRIQNSDAVGTKAQQALQLQREQCKQERREKTKAQREAEKQQFFEQKQEKRKQKHRGH